jgi:hypothetical protein
MARELSFKKKVMHVTIELIVMQPGPLVNDRLERAATLPHAFWTLRSFKLC